jgi:hypothetical protein
MLTYAGQIYAEFVGGISALTTLLYLVPHILRFTVVWIWNLILFILWIALFGVFGSVCQDLITKTQIRIPC